MHPITHLLASWTVADGLRLRERDQALVSWCGVLPDVDGLGVVVDMANRVLGRPGTWYYFEYHHVLLHGVWSALAIPLALAAFARERLRMFLVGVLVVHLHYLGDLVGSRGPNPDDVWPIHYLAPFSDAWSIQWSGQWPLNAWPNVALTLALIGYAFVRAVRDGYSPVGLFSDRADRAFVDAVRARIGHERRSA